MSLLDDARRLAETDPAELVNSHSRCHWCEEFTSTEQHTLDCPWLAIPKIVAALETAERIVQQGPTNECYYGKCRYCGGDIVGGPMRMLHTDDCPLGALEVALSNDEKAEVLTT